MENVVNIANIELVLGRKVNNWGFPFFPETHCIQV